MMQFPPKTPPRHPRARGADPALQFSAIPRARLLKPQLREGQSPLSDSGLNIKGARVQTKEGGCLQPEHWGFSFFFLNTQSVLAMINETTFLPATAPSQNVHDHKTELSKSALRSKMKHPEIPVKSSFLPFKKSTSRNMHSKGLPAASLYLD